MGYIDGRKLCLLNPTGLPTKMENPSVFRVCGAGAYGGGMLFRDGMPGSSSLPTGVR